MKNFICAFILINSLLSCYSQQEKKTQSPGTIATQNESLAEDKSERYIPEVKVVERFDTLIADGQIQIIIERTDLDSYVVQEYNENGKKQIDKYRDAHIALTIKQKSQTLLDTVLRKEQFVKYTDDGFLDIAIFLNYWFNKIDKNQIELFGVINEPETDYAFSFYHYFDLKTKKLTFEEYIEEEE